MTVRTRTRLSLASSDCSTAKALAQPTNIMRERIRYSFASRSANYSISTGVFASTLLTTTSGLRSSSPLIIVK
jgi:hypothetical protein